MAFSCTEIWIGGNWRRKTINIGRENIWTIANHQITVHSIVDSMIAWNVERCTRRIK
jgi:hypothetical protein